MEKRQNEKKAQAPIHDDLDVIPTKDTNRSQKSQISNTSKKSAQNLSYRPDRVKSSIPKAASKPQKQVIHIPTVQPIEIQKAEVERAVRMQREEDIAREAVRRLKDNPNEHISELQTEVALLTRKVEPLLKRVEEAAMNVKIASEGNPLRKGPLGMLGKMGARMINFYADDLAELLL